MFSISGTSCGKRVNNMEEDYWPWLAAICLSESFGLYYRCSGTLIKPHLVLTSAKCMLEDKAKSYKVHLGRRNSEETELNQYQSFSVDDIIVHPDFNALNFAYDLAIIRLSTEATLNDFVQPACLSNSKFKETSLLEDETGAVVSWRKKQETAFIAIVPNVNCQILVSAIPNGTFCALKKSGKISGTTFRGAPMLFKENDVYTVRGILSNALMNYFLFSEVPIAWIEETNSAINPATTPKNLEFVQDLNRCDETCEEYGNPLCTENTPEGKCYCKKGFVRLKAIGLCVQADNRACRAKMPPTKETCARKENEELSEWLYDEPCPNTCANYNVLCSVSVPDGMFYGPHCVCKEGFSRLPNKKCVAIDHPKCIEIWNPTSISPLPMTLRTLRWQDGSSEFDLGMQYSSAGTIPGKHCVFVLDSIFTVSCNYICFNKDYGVRWSAWRDIKGMECTKLLEESNPNARSYFTRTFLCVPQGSPFRFQFSTNGRISGLCCVNVFTHNGKDNYLCVSEEKNLWSRPSVHTNNVNTEELKNDSMLAKMKHKLSTAKTNLSLLGPTNRLWLQYLKMIDILKSNIRSERIGNFKLNLQTLQAMEPFFAASGHNNYTKSVRVFLQDMQDLSRTNPEVYSFFLDGNFITRRKNRFWSGLPDDLVMEQVLMRCIKSAGGLTRVGVDLEKYSVESGLKTCQAVEL
ncbi:Coagulation factor X [Pseudolycoriella hygida]|uniref:Coagulation factor X n=1 Tax=Pseudolycoriella hygida TaxID=35572 RepID=A0A9Q0MZ76_9DIPT|nr:Coagulation factor X [Pseudolycoriella hygida]